MDIEIRLLGIPPSVLNLDKKTIRLAAGGTVQDLINQIVQAYPDLSAQYFVSCTWLVNNQKAGPETVLKDGDSLMILRTLGGG